MKCRSYGWDSVLRGFRDPAIPKVNSDALKLSGSKNCNGNSAAKLREIASSRQTGKHARCSHKHCQAIETVAADSNRVIRLCVSGIKPTSLATSASEVAQW